MLSRSRGVSEVTASLILLLIVSVLGTFLYSYSLNTMGLQQDILYGETKNEAERAQERFKVIATWWSGSGDLLNLTIFNYGKLDIKVVDIYVNGESVTNYQSGRDEEIFSSSWKRICFTSPLPISIGAVYEIVIVSERGVSNVHSWEP